MRQHTVAISASGSLTAMKKEYFELIDNPSKTFDASSSPPDILFTNLDCTKVSNCLPRGISDATIHCRCPGRALKRTDIPSLKPIPVVELKMYCLYNRKFRRRYLFFRKLRGNDIHIKAGLATKRTKQL